MRAISAKMAGVPVNPTKVVCVGLNYRAHAQEMNKSIPDEPLLFLKPPSALIATGEAIVRPRGYQRMDYEGELAVVIGKRARRVSRERALDYVRGFACLNDVTVRDLQVKDVQYTRAKGFDTFCPVGPRVVEGLDPSRLTILTRVNGVTKQKSTTADLIFDVPTLVSFVSRVMTLEEGDLISTGTPPGVGPLVAGDVVEIEIEGIGILSNPVVDEPPGAEGVAG
ncbi:MAG: fumarylacetoacetate hydrolase family protein [Deltaproteobacteria bacterium]|nr:fumarylacetoacetate hydrolase family protein [Deltaproteobacteria bacterium]